MEHDEQKDPVAQSMSPTTSIHSYVMFVSTLTQAVVRARTFAPGEKMSVFAVVITPGQHSRKRIPLGFHGVSDQKEGQLLKRKEFECLYFF